MIQLFNDNDSDVFYDHDSDVFYDHDSAVFNDNDSLNDEEENTRTRKDLSDDNSTFLETIIEETSKRRAKKQRARKRRTKKPMRINR